MLFCSCVFQIQVKTKLRLNVTSYILLLLTSSDIFSDVKDTASRQIGMDW